MQFLGFYGNSGTKETLSREFDKNRIPHAILIDGPAGSGKRTLAKIIAAASVCESDIGLPCGECRQCRNALAGNHPDIVTYEGTQPRSFGVDAVRRIRLDAFVSPNDAAKKVFILANAQYMTEQAQNALLKILEEPPSSVVFILTCDSRTHLLETIKSRAQCVSLGPVSISEAAEALVKQCGIGKDEAEQAARLSGGIIGRARVMLETGFTEISDFFAKFAAALCKTDSYDFLSLSGKLEKDGGLFTTFINMLPALFRDAIAVKTGGAANFSGYQNEANLLARSVAMERLYHAELTALEIQKAADQNVNLMLLLTSLFSRLWQDVHSSNA